MPSLTDKVIASTRRVFDACDLNGDGLLDPPEFHRLLQVLDGDVSTAELLLDFEAADITGDGYIEFKEFIAWWTN